jgi:hypothetical protein
VAAFFKAHSLEDRPPPKRRDTNVSLTVMTLTAGVIYNFIFEYQNQVIINMTVFDGGPSLSN